MFYWIAANLLVLLHLGFVLFVVLGGLLVARWRWLVWLHLPAAFWGVLVEYQGWICPLTPWEQRLRVAGGQSGYSGGFIEHYLLPVLYPGYLDRGIQILLALLVLLINLAVYSWLIGRYWRRK